MKMRTLLAFAVVAVMLATSSSYGFISWFNDSDDLITYADGVTPLAGSTDSSVGCFAQLIFAGSAIDPAVLSGDGTSGDDSVIAKSYFGAGDFFGPDGYLVATETPQPASGNYYVRTWTAPASDYSSGLVPTASSNFYGNSALFAYTAPDPDAEVPFDFGGDGGFACTMQVPEPSFVALAFIGLLTIRLVRRKKA